MLAHMLINESIFSEPYSCSFFALTHTILLHARLLVFSLNVSTTPQRKQFFWPCEADPTSSQLLSD